MPLAFPARTIRSSICSRCLCQWRSSIRFLSSTADTPPPLLAKLKNDMKTAMRAKDTARLNVIRAVISETNQAASGPSPIRTDVQLLALLRKRKSSSLAAAEEAQKAGRPDLQEKQIKEVELLDEYTASVKLMSSEELKEIVMQAVSDMGGASPGMKQGTVMKELLKPGGPLNGKTVDKKTLSDIVQETIST